MNKYVHTHSDSHAAEGNVDRTLHVERSAVLSEFRLVVLTPK